MKVFQLSVFTFLIHVISWYISSFQNEYMKDNFFIKIETWHKPDMGTQENVSTCMLTKYMILSFEFM